MGFIINMTKRTMRDALIGYSRKLGVLPSQVKIKIYTTDPEQPPKYQVFAKSDSVDYQSDVVFKELLFDGINLFDKEIHAVPFIQEAFKRMAKDTALVTTACSPTELMVIIETQETKYEYEPIMYVYKNNQKLQEITFNYFIEGNL